MSLFAARENTTETTEEALATRLGSASVPGLDLHCAYWTPDDGEVFSVFEATAPGSPTQSMLAVVPVTPEEYGPRGVEPAALGEGLGLVLVRRKLDPLSDTEFRAIALQAIMCAYEYSDMRWLRSYWSRGTDQLFCLFETRSHDLVREHARRSRIPCDEVRDAIELKAPASGND